MEPGMSNNWENARATWNCLRICYKGAWDLEYEPKCCKCYVLHECSKSCAIENKRNAILRKKAQQMLDSILCYTLYSLCVVQLALHKNEAFAVFYKDKAHVVAY